MPSTAQQPVSGFEEFDLHHTLQRGIAAAGFTRPRPIQEQAIPAATAGRDVLGLAQTGTGKTAAFALPILDRLLAERKPGPRALVLAPTRELATQIREEFRTLARFTSIRIVTVFGGVSAHRQRLELARRPDVVVACPGRLLDLLGQGALKLDGIETLVLDEADHMFDMGFLPDIRRVLAALPAQRQNLLFSATMPDEIRRLADQTLRDPLVADVEHDTPLATIEHALYPVDGGDKLALLQHLLGGRDFASAIVFTRTKHRARRLALQLERSGHRAVALQGNMSQGQRERAMDGFRRGRFDVLVATDIAARGIDVEQVSHVVNYDMPNTSDAYTHRIGRTGRSDREGKAYTLVTGDDFQLVKEVERRLGEPIARRRVDGIETTPFPEAGATEWRSMRPIRVSGAGRQRLRMPRRRR